MINERLPLCSMLPNKPLPPRPRSTFYAVSPRRGEEGPLGRPSGRDKVVTTKFEHKKFGTTMNAISLARVIAVPLVEEALVWNLVKHRYGCRKNVLHIKIQSPGLL